MDGHEPFSLLEKNEKTFSHVKEYCDALEKGINPFTVDNILQKRELEDHLKRSCKEQDQEECLAWINKNAKPFRSYINSLRVFSLLIFADIRANYRKGVVWEIFCNYVDMWNIEKALVLDSIRMEK